LERRLEREEHNREREERGMTDTQKDRGMTDRHTERERNDRHTDRSDKLQ
jgi:hypothetical protein